MAEDAGEVAIVTGATRGIGFDTARKLAAKGYRVIVTGRTPASAEEAASRLRSTVTGSTVEGMALDLSDFAGIRRFVETFHAKSLPLHLLVNNAGTMVLGDHPTFTDADLESTLAANAVGPMLLTLLLLDDLKRARPARVVNVSSRVHIPGSGVGADVDWDWNDPNGRTRWEAMRFYKNSKLALMWFTYELARRTEGTGVTVNAVCPGFVPATTAESQTGFRRFLTRHVLSHLPSARTIDQASENTVFAATSPRYAERTGAFIGEEREVEASAQARSQDEALRFWSWAARRAGIDVDAK